ncbi:MAG: hypothetical protein LBB17_03720 [Puniceicoccales bacterium]|nr:hypothetical protein [Puniceicoccales bacterium]
MGSDNFFGRINKPNWKPYCQASKAMGVLIEIAGHESCGKAIQDTPNMIKLIDRGITRPKTGLFHQWIYDPSSRRIKLKLQIQTLLFLMKVGGLLVKFSWPLSMFYIALKITLCVVATTQAFMASDKLKSGVTGQYGLEKLLLALIFPLLTDVVPYFYGMWSTEISRCILIISAAYTVFLQDLLKKEGFKDVLLATTSIYELIGSNPFQKKVPEIAKNLWNISKDVTNGSDAVKTLVFSLREILTT